MIEVLCYEEPLGPWWRPVLLAHIEGEERMSAGFMCHNGHYGLLTDHTIADDGTVTPSVVCPTKGCDFHEYVKLDGWLPE